MPTTPDKENTINSISDLPQFTEESSKNIKIWNVFEKFAESSHLRHADILKVKELMILSYDIGKEHQQYDDHMRKVRMKRRA